MELTAKGKEVLRRSWKAGEPLRTRMFEALEPEEFDTLISLLNRVTESLAEESVLRKSATK